MHRRIVGWLAAALVGIGALTPAVAQTQLASAPSAGDRCETTVGQSAFGGDSRVVTARVGPSRVQVLLPPRYSSTHRRYPVLYLLHGAQGSADSWLVYSDLVSFTARQPDARQAVVVMPDATLMTGMDVDWADGTHRWATYVSEELPRWVARHFRVWTDRRHTAIAGYSGGGYSALYLAERHPTRYAAVAGFSPVASLSFAGAAGETALWAAFRAQAICDGSDPAGPGVLPDPVTSPGAWRAADPVAGAGRLRGLDVYVATGDGTPCSASDLPYAAYGFPLAEAAIARTVDDLDHALTANNVRHTTDRYGCGLHWWPWWQRDLHTWWPRMSATLNRG